MDFSMLRLQNPMRAGITETIQAKFPNGDDSNRHRGPISKVREREHCHFNHDRHFYEMAGGRPAERQIQRVDSTRIYKHWICERSVPLKIVSDQAREFVSKGMKQLATYMGTTTITTSGYNPTGNSSVERFHRYLNAALTIIFDKIKANWDEYLPSVLFSYRASANETTGHSPFFLEHGRDPHPTRKSLPVPSEKGNTPRKFCIRYHGEVRICV